jgi:hypothetical protein
MINRVSIYIDPADWLKLRHLCLERGTNPSRIVRQLIASYLSKEVPAPVPAPAAKKPMRAKVA